MLDVRKRQKCEAKRRNSFLRTFESSMKSLGDKLAGVREEVQATHQDNLQLLAAIEEQ